MEFFLNVFTEFSCKKIVIAVKGLEPVTSCIRDQDATTVPARHMWETASLNQTQFMLQWLSISLHSLNSVKVLLHLGKTPIRLTTSTKPGNFFCTISIIKIKLIYEYRSRYPGCRKCLHTVTFLGFKKNVGVPLPCTINCS